MVQILVKKIAVDKAFRRSLNGTARGHHFLNDDKEGGRGAILWIPLCHASPKQCHFYLSLKSIKEYACMCVCLCVRVYMFLR